MKLSQEQILIQTEYWKDTANNDWKTAQSLWKSKRYDACLFYCHLVLEKLLKGLVIKKTKESVPHIHDLVELLRRAKIKTSEEQINKLAVFNGFNIRCRYPKDKTAFYKLCTQKFSEPYFREAQKLVIWIRKFYQKDK